MNNDKCSAAFKTNLNQLERNFSVSPQRLLMETSIRHPNFWYSGRVITDGDFNIFTPKGFKLWPDCLCPPQPLVGGRPRSLTISNSHTFSRHNICAPVCVSPPALWASYRFTGFVSDHLSAVLFLQSAWVTTSETSLFISGCNLSKSLINAESLLFPSPPCTFLLNQCKTKSSITKVKSNITLHR